MRSHGQNSNNIMSSVTKSSLVETNESFISTKTVAGQFACHFCGNTFTAKGSLREHIKQQHEGTFRYICQFCGKGFRVKKNYEGHTNMHTDFRPFQCPNCYKTFSYHNSLRRHVLNCQPASTTQGVFK